MKNRYIVAGAGFKGFCDAMELIKHPGNEVQIIEPAPFFGGIAYSRMVKDFSVDKGVHVFDSIPIDLADIVNEIMDGATKTIDFVSASAFNGVITEGYSLPDLSSLNDEVKHKIKNELLALAKKRPDVNPENLSEVFVHRFGNTAGNIFSDIFENIYSIAASKIEPSGMSHTSLHRLKFLDDEEMLQLKQDPWLETVLAARRKSIGKIDDFVSIYPSSGEGMRGWCDRAAEWLKAKGVKISLGEKIISIKENENSISVTTTEQTYEADKLIWSNDNVNALCTALQLDETINSFQHGTPMVFITFITNASHIKDFTYIQNFDLKGLTYRTASAGLFSNQIRDDGSSFFTCECPVSIDSAYWNDPASMVEKVWQECMELGVVHPDAELIEHDVIKIPVTFKPAKLGYSERIEEIQSKISEASHRVLLRNLKTFFRREIYLDSLKLSELLN